MLADATADATERPSIARLQIDKSKMTEMSSKIVDVNEQQLLGVVLQCVGEGKKRDQIRFESRAEKRMLIQKQRGIQRIV